MIMAILPILTLLDSTALAYWTPQRMNTAKLKKTQQSRTRRTSINSIFKTHWYGLIGPGHAFGELAGRLFERVSVSIIEECTNVQHGGVGGIQS
jgi:hypothetical protein